MKKILACRICTGLIFIICSGNSIWPQDSRKIAAVVNGRNIMLEELDNAMISEIFGLEQQIYSLRKAALENLVSKITLEGEARRKGIAVEELRRQLTAGKVEISTAQVEEVYSENASAFAAMSPDEAKERLRLDLESQARMKLYRDALAALKKNSTIDIRLKEPRLPVLDDGRSPTLGTKEAIVTIFEFSDFQCPYCRQSQSALKKIMQSHAQNLKLVFKHFPLEIHSEAFAAAQAAYCAGEQGSFWKYHDALFALDRFSPEIFKKKASDFNLDMPRFSACMDSEASRTAILADIREAKRLGINSTPTFIINGRLFRGVSTFEDFQAVIEHELKLSKTEPRAQ